MTSLTDLVLSHRTPLPSHALEVTGADTRAWAIAVCDAEIKYADQDFRTVIHKLNVSMSFDRDVDRAAAAPVRFAHELAAGLVLNWASHLQNHEGDPRKAVWRWAAMGAEERRVWRVRWIMLTRGFLKAVAAYKAARGI